jgi:hypothetical protein
MRKTVREVSGRKRQIGGTDSTSKPHPLQQYSGRDVEMEKISN